METLITFTSTTSYLLLSALLLGAASIAWPYRLNKYNTEWLPSFIRPDIDYLDTRYAYYYPADESRKTLCFAFLLTAWTFLLAYICNKWNEVVEYLLYFFSFVPACYLLHRNYCFHKQNEHTKWYVDNSISFLVYKPWKVALPWLLAFLLPLLTITGYLPIHYFLSISIGFTLLVLTLLLWECRKEYICCKKGLCKEDGNPHFLDLMPYSYYLTLFIVSILVVQSAAMLHSLLLLALYPLIQIAFTVLKYRFRFNYKYFVDVVESWGHDTSCQLLSTYEEIEILRERELKAIRKKNNPCWTLILQVPNKEKYRVEITADLENKQAELYLQHRAVLYLRGFSNVKEAIAHAKWCEIHPEEPEKLILELNPQKENLFFQSTNELSKY